MICFVACTRKRFACRQQTSFSLSVSFSLNVAPRWLLFISHTREKGEDPPYIFLLPTAPRPTHIFLCAWHAVR